MNQSIVLNKAPGYRWWILLMNVLAYGHFFMTIQTSAAFGTAIQAEWGLNATKLGLLTTATMISFSFFAGIGGKCARKIGMSKTVCLAILVNCIISVLFIPFAKSYIAAIVLRFLQGISGGLMASSIVAGTSLWFPTKQRGLASGILFGVLGLGFSIATAIAPILLNRMTWQVSMAVMVAGSGIVVLLIYYFSVKDIEKAYPGYHSIDELMPKAESTENVENAINEHQPANMKEAKRSKGFKAAAIFGFCSAWLTYGFSAFLANFLISDRGIDANSVTTIISMTFFVTIVASPLAGIFSDKVFKGQRYQTLMIASLMTVVSLILSSFVGSSLIPVVLILAYASVSMCTGPFWAVPSQMFHPSIAGECTGLLTLIANIGGIIVVPILSGVIDVTGSSYICLVLCIMAALISILCAKIIKH